MNASFAPDIELVFAPTQFVDHGLASIMPRIVRGHTKTASIMIGEKASDLILSATAARSVLR